MYLTLKANRVASKLQKCVINDVFDFKGYSIYKGSENDFSFRRGW